MSAATKREAVEVRPKRGRAMRAALLLTAAYGYAALAQEPTLETDGEAAAFAAFLGELRTAAAERGIRAETLDTVFPGIRLRRQAIQADRGQAEFVQTYEAYLQRVSPQRIESGRALLEEHGEMIRPVAADYDVQPRFIAAIIGLESNYGTYPITEPLFDVVATLAFEGRRGAQFRAQFLAGLEIVDKGYATVAQMKSSWAGALGVPQFTPTNVLQIAVDHDQDGRIDLWSVGPDVVASVARYLQRTGWRADQTWGREVTLPAGGEESLAAPIGEGETPPSICRSYESLGAFRVLSDWQALGVRRRDGGDLPARDLPAALIVGDRGDDRGWLVYRNFCSLMRYNPAFRYALSVGLLADALAPEPPAGRVSAGADSAN
jgi:membrane-bound lytic murein transglycosylase B